MTDSAPATAALFDVDVDVYPPIARSVVGGLVIGWEFCGACNDHILNCTCKQISEPQIIQKWREEERERPR